MAYTLTKFEKTFPFEGGERIEYLKLLNELCGGIEIDFNPREISPHESYRLNGYALIKNEWFFYDSFDTLVTYVLSGGPIDPDLLSKLQNFYVMRPTTRDVYEPIIALE